MEPYALYMVFNKPSMQAYHAGYCQVRDVRGDFILMDKARQWMIEFSVVPTCSDLLEKYPAPGHAEAALVGEIPLCYDSIKKALKERYHPPQLAHGHRKISTSCLRGYGSGKMASLAGMTSRAGCSLARASCAGIKAPRTLCGDESKEIITSSMYRSNSRPSRVRSPLSRTV
jgi:hypothetical protein